MSANLRPVGAYVHGIDGPVAVVSGRVAAWLERNLGLDRLRVEQRGGDVEVDNVLLAICTVATAWRASATGSTRATHAEVAPPSLLSTRSAADELSVTDRAIRLACEQGRIEAELAGGRWRITREAFEDYKAGREVG